MIEQLDVRTSVVINALRNLKNKENVNFLALAVALQIPKAEVEEIAFKFEYRWKVTIYWKPANNSFEADDMDWCEKELRNRGMTPRIQQRVKELGGTIGVIK